MAAPDFEAAFQKMLVLEGGLSLHQVPGDRGGQTYAGISRRAWPHWPGWAVLDAGDDGAKGLTAHVRAFYRERYWDRGEYEKLADGTNATMLFCCAVNMGFVTGTRLAQIVVGVIPDGDIGPITRAAIDGMDPEVFRLQYFVARVNRYVRITKDPSQLKFLRGWLNRATSTLQ